MEELTRTQLKSVTIIERTSSVLSLFGCLFIIATFCCSRSFRKPINRMIFYASFGNLMTNVGTLIARSSIDSPDSAVCQLQGFLLQTFMDADVFWSLAMAINVYLTFFRRFDAQALRKMDIPYLVGCYGIPFIPAFTYLFLRNKTGQRVYGDATIWCWVVPQWEVLRVTTFYGPVWVIIAITMGIYVRCGRTIYENRKKLGRFYNSNDASSDGQPVKTTQVTVTSELRGGAHADFQMQAVGFPAAPLPCQKMTGTGMHTVHVTARADDLGLPTHGQTRETEPPPHPEARPAYASKPARRRRREFDTFTWAYTKCAILFFAALLVTWIPSSANRLYPLIHGGQRSAALQIISALVLPLQGFWNAIIYAVTSWRACKGLLDGLSLARMKARAVRLGGAQHQGSRSYESIDSNTRVMGRSTF